MIYALTHSTTRQHEFDHVLDLTSSHATLGEGVIVTDFPDRTLAIGGRGDISLHPSSQLVNLLQITFPIGTSVSIWNFTLNIHMFIGTTCSLEQRVKYRFLYNRHLC